MRRRWRRLRRRLLGIASKEDDFTTSDTEIVLLYHRVFSGLGIVRYLSR